MKIYMRILSMVFFVGAVYHTLNFFGYPNDFVQTNLWFKAWSIFQVPLEIFAGVQILRSRPWGIYTFYILFYTKLIAYSVFSDYFAYPTSLLVFQIAIMTGYVFFAYRIVAADLAKSMRPKPRATSN